ncbi:MAG: hypothetical protein KUG77_28765 [Nannocystaceae bacterium]|nr:hypothetical protein [Nannocystaceae bacterium]
MRPIILPLFLTLAASCTGHSSTNKRDEPQEGTSLAQADLTAVKVDDVWIFVGPAEVIPNPGNLKIIQTDDRQGGQPTVEDDCLFVGGEVVVWWSEQTEFAKRIVGDAKTGRSSYAPIPGGEGRVVTDAPPLISERCGVMKIRHAGKGR